MVTAFGTTRFYDILTLCFSSPPCPSGRENSPTMKTGSFFYLTSPLAPERIFRARCYRNQGLLVLLNLTVQYVTLLLLHIRYNEIEYSPTYRRNKMKSGITTSEFWVTIVYTVIMALVGFGVIPQVEADEIKDLLAPLIASAVPVAMYIYSRMKVKTK